MTKIFYVIKIHLNIIYSFVDLDVLHDYEFHNKNADSHKCNYRVVEDINIFGLIEDIPDLGDNGCGGCGRCVLRSSKDVQEDK